MQIIGALNQRLTMYEQRSAWLRGLGRARARDRACREKAEKTLGAKFNIRAFHEAVLELGSLPLSVVTGRVDRFIVEGGKGLIRIWSE